MADVDLSSATKMYDTGHKFMKLMLTELSATGSMDAGKAKTYSAIAQACFAGAQARAIIESLTNLNQEKP